MPVAENCATGCGKLATYRMSIGPFGPKATDPTISLPLCRKHANHPDSLNVMVIDIRNECITTLPSKKVHIPLSSLMEPA